MGYSRVLTTITKAALVVRLAGLLMILLASVGRPLAPAIAVGICLAGVTSYAGLTRRELLHVVQRHPSLALLDLFIVTAPAALSGVDSPYVLVLLPSALLLGLWVDLWAGVLVTVSLVGLYLLSLTSKAIPQEQLFMSVVVLPFVYVSLWYLGLTIRRTVESEAAAQRVVHDAVASNAAVGERTTLARTLHDSLAKTIQGLVLTAAALPTLIERDAPRAVETARELQSAGSQAVHELRVVMGSLRERTSEEPLSVSLVQVALAWERRTGRDLTLDIPDGVDTADEAIRYEVLACVTEALENVHRHAGSCQTRLTMEVRDRDQLLVTVADDGTGMTPEEGERARAAGHYGISGIRERMARVGGTTDVDSTPGRGTRVSLRVHREGLIES